MKVWASACGAQERRRVARGKKRMVFIAFKEAHRDTICET
jgi:hypothetical protein